MIGRTLSIALRSALACFAQEQTATLTGTVIDPLGLPIANAKVQIDSEATNGPHFSSNTDYLGQFRFADIPPGSYRLEVYSPGFYTWRKDKIRLLAGQQSSLQSAVLNVGIRCGEPFIDGVQRLATGDDSSTMRGSVVDSSGAPVGGASVSINCAGCVTKTNPEGQFLFPHLTPGNYTLTVSMIGFYREFLPNYEVRNNLDWTYAPVRIERCPTGGCEQNPRPMRIFLCE